MVGLVLEGGGVKGSYQIGAYFAFKYCHIKINGFVGTSIGSFNAAMLAAGKDHELLDFWYNVNPGEVLGFDEDFLQGINNGEISLKSMNGLFKTIGKIIKDVGIENDGLIKKMNEVLDERDLRKSKADFGLVTVKLPTMKPLYTYKEMIPIGKLKEYILASCYLPIFKHKKLIDNHYYLDGGFYDNSPVNMLADLGYKKIYVIKIKGIGIDRHHTYNDVNIINVVPSRKNGLVLELNQEVIRDNILMGYYDTLRVLKNYDGYKYVFKRRSKKYYDFITRKINLDRLKKLRRSYRVKSNKELVIKIVEKVLEKEDKTYYKVYNIYNVIRKLKKIKKDNIDYKFIKDLRFL